jgi:hypothetical protein
MSAVLQDLRARRQATWFGLFGGALAWTVHLMLAYGVAEFGCVGRLADREYAGVSLVAWLEIALTIATTLTAGAATWVAHRQYGRLKSGLDNFAESAERRIAWTGVITSGLFTFIIVFESIPILYYLHTC